MKILKKPELTLLEEGETLKTLHVTAKTGMQMPSHHATHEAIIVVQQGEAILTTPDGNYLLTPGKSFLLPANMDHSLEIKEDFEAIVVMDLQSEIKFARQINALS